LRELVRNLNPDIDTAVRTHTAADVAQLMQQDVGVAIMGERELAFGLVDYALRSLGVPDRETQLVVQEMRVSGEGGVYDRRPEEPSRRAPELRQHRVEEPSSE
jgi:CPA2 family monovalent cation:H+ antiporter-2